MLKDPVILGLTRPTMRWGVTDTALLLNIMASGIAFIASNSFLVLSMAIPVHLLSYAICKYEPRQFELLASWFQTKGKCVNRKVWAGSSSSPLPKGGEIID